MSQSTKENQTSPVPPWTTSTLPPLIVMVHVTRSVSVFQIQVRMVAVRNNRLCRTVSPAPNGIVESQSSLQAIGEMSEESIWFLMYSLHWRCQDGFQKTVRSLVGAGLVKLVGEQGTFITTASLNQSKMVLVQMIREYPEAFQGHLMEVALSNLLENKAHSSRQHR